MKKTLTQPDKVGEDRGKREWQADLRLPYCLTQGGIVNGVTCARCDRYQN